MTSGGIQKGALTRSPRLPGREIPPARPRSIRPNRCLLTWLEIARRPRRTFPNRPASRLCLANPL